MACKVTYKHTKFRKSCPTRHTNTKLTGYQRLLWCCFKVYRHYSHRLRFEISGLWWLKLLSNWDMLPLHTYLYETIWFRLDNSSRHIFLNLSLKCVKQWEQDTPDRIMAMKDMIDSKREGRSSSVDMENAQADKFTTMVKSVLWYYKGIRMMWQRKKKNACSSGIITANSNAH